MSAQKSCVFVVKHWFSCPCLYRCGNCTQLFWLTSWSKHPSANTGKDTKKMLNADMSQSLYTTCPDARVSRLYAKRVRPKAMFL